MDFDRRCTGMVEDMEGVSHSRSVQIPTSSCTEFSGRWCSSWGTPTRRPDSSRNYAIAIEPDATSMTFPTWFNDYRSALTEVLHEASVSLLDTPTIRNDESAPVVGNKVHPGSRRVSAFAPVEIGGYKVKLLTPK